MANKEKNYRKTNRGGKSKNSGRSSNWTKSRNDDDCTTTDRRNSDAGKGSSFRGDNHPEWYITTEAQAAACASLPFGRPAGFPIQVAGSMLSKSDDKPYEFTTPGIGVLRYVPSLGDTTQGYASPINVAGQAAYTMIRKNNAGAKNYEPADLLVYLGAMDSIYQMYYIGERAYKSLFAYSVMNRNYPRMLVTAQGFNYEDLVKHIADFRAYLLHIRNVIQQMAVPNHFSIFARHEFITRNIFVDDPLTKGQIYLMRPEMLYSYSSADSETGSQLVGSHVLNRMGDGIGAYRNNFTFDAYRGFMDDMINSVVSDIDCAIISGDIVKAYPNNLYTLAPFDPDKSIDVLYDMRFLLQVHNAVLHGHCRKAQMYQVIPEIAVGAPYLETVYQCVSNCPIMTHWIIDIPSNDPTYKDVVSATRLMSCWGEREFVADGEGQMPNNSWQHNVTNAGSEFCTVMELWALDAVDGEGTFFEYSTWDNSIRGKRDILDTPSQSINDIVPLFEKYATLAQLDWAPLQYLLWDDADFPNDPRVLGFYGKITNMSTLDLKDRLTAINNMAWAKMLAIDIKPN